MVRVQATLLAGVLLALAIVLAVPLNRSGGSEPAGASTAAPTLTPCGFAPPPTHTPGSTEFDALIPLQFTNGSGETASDLHICLSTGVGFVSLETNAPDCPAPTVSHQTRGRDIDVVWPSACVDVGEIVVVRVGAPGSVSVQCSHWTLFGEPLQPPCGPTPTPSPTPSPPSPTFPCPAGPDPSGGCLPCPTYVGYARAAIILSTCPPIVTPTPTPSPTPSPTGPPCPVSLVHAGPVMGVSACTSTPVPDIQGDSNCDGTISSTDALAVLRFTAGLPVQTSCSGFDGDVDCNLVTNAVDALKILRHNANLSVLQNEPCPDIGTLE